MHNTNTLAVFLLVFLVCGCTTEGADGPPVDWKSYQDTICLNIFRGEIVLPALGHGSRCGHPTPNCNQAYCGACAAALGVCEVCGKKNDWTRNTNPTVEVPLLFALLEESKEVEPRRIALHALTQIGKPDTLSRMMKFSDDQDLSLQLAAAVGAFQDRRYNRFLQSVLHRAGANFWEQEDYEGQYYRLAAARAAAATLVALGDRQAEKILFAAARNGGIWVQVAALGALGGVDSDHSRQVLSACLKEFFAKDGDWKWIPGRELIGTALKSLALIGKKDEALQVLGYMRSPGCDFLYTDLAGCLAKIGRPIVPEISAAIRDGVQDKQYDQGTMGLIEVLGDLNDPSAVPVLREMLDWQYSDQWVREDATQKAITGLGKLKAHEAIDRIAFELLHSPEEATRYQAA
jgi:HEAT repeat protein